MSTLPINPWRSALELRAAVSGSTGKSSISLTWLKKVVMKIEDFPTLSPKHKINQAPRMIAGRYL